MNAARKKRLESAGWRVGTADEFLGLSEEEAKIVEMKLAVGDSLRRYRIRRGWTQQDLARRLGCRLSQPFPPGFSKPIPPCLPGVRW